jgi:choline-sulfatase
VLLVAAGAMVDAAVAGAAAGIVELLLVAGSARIGWASLPALSLVVVGLSVAVVALAGAPLVVVMRGLGRHPSLRRFAGQIGSPGPDRVRALVGAAVWVASAGLVWLAVFGIQSASQGVFMDADSAALLIATVTTVLAAAALFLGAALAPALGRALASWRGLQRVTRGPAGLVLAVAVVVVVGLAARGVVGSVAPLWDPTPVYSLGAAGVALLIVAVARVSRRLGRRRLLAAGCALAALAVGALGTVGSAPRARRALMAHGELSRSALRVLHRLGDRDGDGFSGAFGGGDCDDGDAAVHPRSREIPGNARDDNCLGGDVEVGALARRLAPAPTADATAPRHDILLVTIDALRADRVSVYGYGRATTPVLDRLAGRGTRFGQAEAPSTVTRLSVPAILFGRYPSALPFERARGVWQLAKHRLPTLASTLAGAGYRTAALLPTQGMVGKQELAGFAETHTATVRAEGEPNPDNAAQVTDRAIAWISRQAKSRGGTAPWFLWIHYVDPHGPYERPPGARDFGSGPEDRYDGEIAHVDAQIGRLLASLSEGGRADRTIIVISSDHGESFGEHGTITHGKSLYEELTHVPLVIAVPGGAARLAAGRVSLVDLAPTVLDLVGLDAPAGMNGVSLAAAVRAGAPVPPHPVLAELLRDRRVPRDLVALYRGDWKLIRDLEVDAVELYDLRDDPDEADDRSDLDVSAELDVELGRVADAELAQLPAQP